MRAFNNPLQFKNHLLLFSVCFLAVRLIVLLFLEPEHYFVYPDEEVYRGAFALDLINGLKFPFLDYRADDFTGGFYIVSLLTSFFLKFFPPTVAALKATPLALSLGAFIFFYLAIKNKFNQKIANFFAILFIASPYAVTQYGLTTLGDHTETMFFTALGLLLFFKMSGAKSKKSLYALCSGITLGFGLWFAYITLISIAAIGVYWLLLDIKMPLKKHFFLWVLGLGIGFSPWLYFNLQTGFAGTTIRGETFDSLFHLSNLGSILTNFTSSAPVKIFALFVSYDLTNAGIKFYLYAYLVLFLFVFTGWVSTKPKFDLKHPITLFAIYLVLFALALQLSDKRFVRYRIPAYPFIITLLSFGLWRLSNSSIRIFKNAPFFVITSLFTLGFAGWSPLVSLSHPFQAFQKPAHAYNRLAYLDYCSEDFQCLKLYETLKETLPSEEIEKLGVIFSHEMATNRIDILTFEEDVIRLRNGLPVEMLNAFDFYTGFVAFRETHNLEESFELISFLKKVSASAYHNAVRGCLSLFGYVPHAEINFELSLKYEKIVPSSLRADYWKYQANALAHDWHKRGLLISEQLEIIEEDIPTDMKGYFLMGLGNFAYQHWLANSPEAPYQNKFRPTLDSARLPWFYEGLGDAHERVEMLHISRPWRWERITENMSKHEINWAKTGRKKAWEMFQTAS